MKMSDILYCSREQVCNKKKSADYNGHVKYKTITIWKIFYNHKIMRIALHNILFLFLFYKRINWWNKIEKDNEKTS